MEKRAQGKSLEISVLSLHNSLKLMSKLTVTLGEEGHSSASLLLSTKHKARALVGDPDQPLPLAGSPSLLVSGENEE